MNLRLKIPQDYKSSGSKMRTGDLKTTYYVLDAQGNAMSNYSFTTRPTDAKANKLVLQERNIYGSKRVGIEQLQLVVAEPAYVTPDSRWEDVWELPAYTPISMRDYHWSWYKNRPSVPVSTYKQEIGDKRYELANHLGNVLNVVTDRKLPVDIPLTANSPQGDGIVDYFTADVVSYSDYLPFGQVMPNRHGDDNQYRYGFNGKEKDDEVEGEGNIYDYGFRIYNPRLGRFLSVDPLAKKYAMLSVYQFASNSPIMAIDYDGLEAKISMYGAGIHRDNTGKITEKNHENQFKLESDNQVKLKNTTSSVAVHDVGIFIQTLEKYTSEEGAIQYLFIASNASNHGLILDNGQYGLDYLGTKPTVNNSQGNSFNVKNFYSDFAENKNIKFTKDALVVFAGCNAGSTLFGKEKNVAAQFTLITGVATIGADGYTMPVNGTNRVADRNYNLFYMDENNKLQTLNLGKTLDAKAIKTAQDKIAEIQKLKEIKENETKNEESTK